MSNSGVELGIGPQQAMTPQLQQALRLLRLPARELQSQVQQALETNVMLETDEEFDMTWTLETESVADADVVERNEPWSFSSASEPGMPVDSQSTLREHLAWQLALAPLPNGPRAIGRALIDAIDDDGFLTRTPQAIADVLAAEVRADASVVEGVLAIIQQFDPAGVGARSVAECIGLQLAQLEPATAGLDAARIIAHHHLEMAASQQFLDLQRLTGCSGQELEAALALIRSCDQRPGAAFRSQRSEYAVPDVFARHTPHGWTVELNPAAAPRVRLNERYAAMVTGSADQAALRAQLQAARWLVNSLEIRNETVQRVARTIVYRQKAFLDWSEESIRPMFLRDVAEAVDMHESTVLRVTTGKFLHTPRGAFEFRFFFSSQIPSADGNDIASIARRLAAAG
jgi:RNA polymerase sigma-54 factor